MSMPPPPPYNPGAVPPPPYNPGNVPPPGYQQYQQYQAAPEYAGFGSRLGALLLDSLIGGLFAAPAIVALFAGPKEYRSCTVNGEAGICNLPTGATVGMAVALGAVFGIAYLVIFCRMVGKGQSWGMKVVSIRVADADSGQSIGTGRAFGWELAHVLSGMFCYLGYLWMLWDKRKQCWHDKIVGTVVVKGDVPA
jgi:uncharacterized RDD family membrane protein YckC